jgi:hypothetical protein
MGDAMKPPSETPAAATFAVLILTPGSLDTYAKHAWGHKQGLVMGNPCGATPGAREALHHGRHVGPHLSVSPWSDNSPMADRTGHRQGHGQRQTEGRQEAEVTATGAAGR